MKDPTPKEIESWEKRLYSDNERLMAFQNEAYKICEEQRQRMDMRFIRVVLARHKVKSLKSIVMKITKERKNNPNFDLRDVTDLIGIKIICPYTSSVKEVCKWLYTNTDHFNISPLTIEEAFVSYETGYIGYHFAATPNVIRYQDWYDLICEIQVKTMCQEAWDAMTHEITYKQEETVDPYLLRHMTQLSHILTAVDEQGEIIKMQIEWLELEERERKDAAAITFFGESTSLINYLKDRYSINFSVDDPRQWTFQDCQNLNIALIQYRREAGVNIHLCYLAALIAICHKDPQQEGLALTLANEYVDTHPNDPIAVAAKAAVCWGLNRFDQAIICGKEAIEKSIENQEGKKLDPHKANFCYWAADAVLKGKKLNPEIYSQVLKYAHELIDKHPKNPSYLDTGGFVLIALEKDIKKIEEGLKLVRLARSLAYQSNDSKAILFADTFCARHERLAFLRLAQMYR